MRIDFRNCCDLFTDKQIDVMIDSLLVWDK